MEIAAKPIAGKHVERLLEITAAERRRLTKAGLLPVSGSAAFSVGRQAVQLPTYSAEAIERLRAAKIVVE